MGSSALQVSAYMFDTNACAALTRLALPQLSAVLLFACMSCLVITAGTLPNACAALTRLALPQLSAVLLFACMWGLCTNWWSR